MHARQNQRFLRIEHRISETYNLIASLQVEAQQELLDELMAIMATVQREKHLQWDTQRDPHSQNNPHHINTSIFFYCGERRSASYRSTVLTSLVLYHIYHTPRRAIRVLLSGFSTILRSVNLSDIELHLLPKDPRSSTAYYNIQPIT
ncbi:hypothetical protein BJ165DRAFT_1533496 [Panaeolus papilionaceus]|nr:hypothetical protein BJ165DRAFT_1533496 [Panaeolus papilionaceus]